MSVSKQLENVLRILLVILLISKIFIYQIIADFINDKNMQIGRKTIALYLAQGKLINFENIS